MTMTRRSCTLSLILAAAFWLLAGPALTSAAQKKPKKEPAAPAAAPARAEEDPKVTDAKAAAVADIGLAYQLADYGRRQKSPEAIINAAFILRKIKAMPFGGKVATGTEDANGKFVAEGDPEAAEEVSFLDEADKLLDEARKLSRQLTDEKMQKLEPEDVARLSPLLEKDHATVVEYADRVGRILTKGLSTGPQVTMGKVKPKNTKTYTLQFFPGRPAHLAVNGDSSTVLRLAIFDAQGNRLAVNEGRNCAISFIPGYPGPYFLRITNTGFVVNTYRLAGN
jgi:hypothetical protein